MTNTLEYRIGYVELKLGPNDEQKFLVCLDSNSLVYHAKAIKGEQPKHKDIAQQLGLCEKSVEGGGLTTITHWKPDILQVYGESSTFGGIPSGIMEGFKSQLLKVYQRIIPNLRDVNIDTYGPNITDDIWLQRRFPEIYGRHL